MAQMQWIFAADSGQQYRVDLFHGERSGHLLVTVNDKVSLIDFFVRESKDYTLMLEEEVFRLEVEKTPEGFRYGFMMDERADTTTNVRKRRTRRRQYAIAILSLALFFALAVVGLLRFQDYQDARVAKKSLPYIREIGQPAMGRISGNDAEGWVIHYVAGVTVCNLKVGPVPAGIPALRAGDDMQVLHLVPKPRIGEVNWNAPGPRRSTRLYAAWQTETYGPGEPIGHAFECVLAVVAADSAALGDPGAPWHRTGFRTLETWLSTRPALVDRIAATCPLGEGEEGER